VIEHLPSKWKALNSNINTAKKTQKQKSEMQCCEILGRKAKERRGCWARGVLSPFSGISYANTGAYT
jgi:hypothetical protein